MGCRHQAHPLLYESGKFQTLKVVGDALKTLSVEYVAFTSVVDRVLSVSHQEMKTREAEYRAQVEANPSRRGPKRGSKKKPKIPAEEKRCYIPEI